MVLLVDDEPEVLEFGETVINSLGYDVLTATEGESAVRIINERRESISCVVMDRQMPNLDGEAALEQMQALAPLVAVVVVTG